MLMFQVFATSAMMASGYKYVLDGFAFCSPTTSQPTAETFVNAVSSIVSSARDLFLHQASSSKDDDRLISRLMHLLFGSSLLLCLHNVVVGHDSRVA